MATPITWKSIGTPNLGDPGKSMALAQMAFKESVGGLQGLLDKNATMQEENWKTGKTNNTNAFLTRLSQFQTPEEAQAAMASGELSGMLQGFGNQVDTAAVLAAKQGLVKRLQDAAISGQQYTQGVQAHKDWQQELRARPIVDALTGNLLQVDGQLGVNNIRAAVQARVDAGELDPRQANAILLATNARGTDLTKQEREGLTWDEQRKEWTRAAEAHTADIAAKKADTRYKNAQAANVGSGGGGAAALGPIVSALEKMGERAIAGPTASNERSIFRGDLAFDPKGRAATEKILGDTGISAWNAATNVTNFADNVLKAASTGKDAVLSPDGKELLLRDGNGRAVAVPFTQALFESAIRQDKGSVTDPSVGDVVSNLRALAKREDLVDEALKFGTNQNQIRAVNDGVAEAIARALQGKTDPKGQKKSQ
jgi:hypothetical protein